MRRKTGFLTTIIGLLLITALSVVAQANVICPTLVQESYTATEFLCETVPDGQACIGNGVVNATPADGATITFANPGELAPLAQIQRLQVQTLNTETQAWTSVTGKLDSTIRSTGEDTFVDMLLFGDAVMTNAVTTAVAATTADVLPATIEAAGGVIMRQEPNVSSNNVWQLVNGEEVRAIGRSADNQWIRIIIPSPNGKAAWVFAQFVNVEGGRELLPFHTNASPIPASLAVTEEFTYKPMQAFRVESLLTDPACAETTDSGVMLQSGEERSIVEINGVEIRLKGTIFVTAQVGDKMTVYNLEGETTVLVDNDRVDMTLATVTEIPMDASLAPTGAPSAVTPYSQEVANTLIFLPVRLLSRNFEVSFIDPSLTADTSTTTDTTTTDTTTTDTTTSEQQSAPPPPAATQAPPEEEAIDPEQCPTLIQESYTASEFLCEGQASNTACIGNIGTDGLSQSQPQENVENFAFVGPGDTAIATDILFYQSTVFDQPDRVWNVISMKIDADTVTGGSAEATVLTFGEVDFINAGEVVTTTATTDTATVPPPADTTTTDTATVPPPADTTTTDTTTVATGTPAAINAPGGIIVRAEPIVNAETVGQLSNTDPVTALGISGDQLWVQVQNTDGSITGWVFAQFVAVDGGIEALETVDPNAVVPPPPATNTTTETTTDTTTTDTSTTTDTTTTADTSETTPAVGTPGAIQSGGPVVVRNLPRVDTETIGQFDNGTPVTVLGKSVDLNWIQVQSTDGSVTGWIFQQFVAVDGGTESLPIIDPASDTANNSAPPPPAGNTTTAPPPAGNTTTTDTTTTAPPPPPAGNTTTTTTTTGDEPEYTSMQAFQLISADVDSRCTDSHDGGVMIQSPDGIDGKMKMRINDIDLAISGTIFVRSELNISTNIIALEGEIDITSGDTTQTLEAGQETSVKLINGLTADGPPNLPNEYSFSKGRRLPNLPIRLLPRNFTPIVPPDPGDATVINSGGDDSASSGDGVTPLGGDVVAVGGTIVDFGADCEISAGDKVRNLRADAGSGFDVINTLQPGQSLTGVTQKRGTDSVYWYETTNGWIRSDAGVMSPDCENLPLFGVIYDASSVGGSSVESVAPAAPPPPPQPTAVPPPPVASDAFGNVCANGGNSFSQEIEQGGVTYVEFGGVWTGQGGTSITFSADIPYYRPELGNVLTFVNEDGSQWLGSVDGTVFTVNFDSTRRFRVRVAGLLGDFVTLRVNC